MSVYSDIHFCLIGSSAPVVNSRAHADLADTIEVSIRIGSASFVVSGRTADVRSLLAEMHAAALRVVPLAAPTAKVQP